MLSTYIRGSIVPDTVFLYFASIFVFPRSLFLLFMVGIVVVAGIRGFLKPTYSLPNRVFSLCVCYLSMWKEKPVICSFEDPDPESVTERNPCSYFRELSNNFFWLKILFKKVSDLGTGT